MSTDIQPIPGPSRHAEPAEVLQVIVYGHSWLFYWWPLWVVGYVMALLTWLHPDQVVIGDKPEVFQASRNLGVIYALLLLLMIVITSAKVRGLAGALVIACLAFLALLFAYLDWWQNILGWLGNQSIYLNLGFYLHFSTALFVVWLVTFVVIDHLSFWRFRPGQVTHEYLGGVVDKSYDTDNMIFSKRQDDLFRHWIIGLGSGDLHMQTMGGRGMDMNVGNVLFVGAKMFKIQRLIATKPDEPQQA
jgi:hypothetical protein